MAKPKKKPEKASTRFASPAAVRHHLSANYGLSDADITRLVEAVQLGFSVAEASEVAFKVLPALHAFAGTGPGHSPVYRVTNRDPRLRYLLRIGKSFSPLASEILRPSIRSATGRAKRLVDRDPFVADWQKRLAAHGIMMCAFALATAASRGLGSLPAGAMDALVQLAGVRLPSLEFTADPKRRKERTRVWQTTMDRAAAFLKLLPD